MGQDAVTKVFISSWVTTARIIKPIKNKQTSEVKESRYVGVTISKLIRWECTWTERPTLHSK